MTFGRTYGLYPAQVAVSPLGNTSANMQRVWHYGAIMRASMRLYPAMWVVSRTTRQGVAQSPVGAAALKTIAVDCVEGDPA